jgi:GntR family transcriptional repressor for pyruvate dehydrogenase complex
VAVEVTPVGGAEPAPFNRPRVGSVIRAPKTAELIAARLRSQIVRGELKTGDTLPAEAGLMIQFGVSRPTLREAFRILETESLIYVRRGSRGGARVTAPELSVAARYVGLLLQVEGTTIADVYEARKVLEPACVARLAARRSAADIRALRAAADELAAAVDHYDVRSPAIEQLSQHTVRFHALLMELCGSRTLAVQGGVLQDIVATHTALSVSRDMHSPDIVTRFRKTVRSYRRLVDLIEAGDAARAEKHWVAHLDAAFEAMGRADITSVVDLFR